MNEKMRRLSKEKKERHEEEPRKQILDIKANVTEIRISPMGSVVE